MSNFGMQEKTHFEYKGYRVTVTRRSRDNHADLFLFSVESPFEIAGSEWSMKDAKKAARNSLDMSIALRSNNL